VISHGLATEAGLFCTSAISRLCTGETKPTKKAPEKEKENYKNIFKKYSKKINQKKHKKSN
jgi:hypothetical protein